jgi:hypothetical protein
MQAFAASILGFDVYQTILIAQLLVFPRLPASYLQMLIHRAVGFELRLPVHVLVSVGI